MRAAFLALAAAFLFAPAVHAATQADAEAALAAAHKDEAHAERLHNRWTPTETALKQAKQELAAEKFDEALATAKRAQALAERSIEQSHAQDKLWRNEVIP